MGRDDKDREDSGPVVRLPTDFLKNPLLLIFLSLASGGTGMTLFVERNEHEDAVKQLRATQERMIVLQESFLTNCAPCGQASELNYTLRDKLYEIDQDIKTLNWNISRMNDTTREHLHNNQIHDTGRHDAKAD